MSTQVIEKKTAKPDRGGRKKDPGYRVLLHNDPFNTMEYVVETLMQTVGMNEAQAVTIMMETHTTGIGLVTVCMLEHAEFYSESLKSKGLTSTIEPAE